MVEKGHSEDYFGDERDFWWNKDFLDLMAKRWNLQQYSSLLDVGAGMCHWNKLLGKYLKKTAHVCALDSDPKWAAGNDSIKKYFEFNNINITFKQGDAHLLPFPDNSFDVVTCQTVLIHLKNPKQALLEMKRVVKNSGIIICAEMNNIAGSLVKSSIMDFDNIEETLDRVKYYLLYEKGKKKLGEGDNSLGDLIPGLFSEINLESINVFLSDKASPVFSPYETIEQKALLKTLYEWNETESGDYDRKQTLRYFQSMGKEGEHIDLFHREWPKIKNDLTKKKFAISKKQYHTGGAYLMYLISGIKCDK